MDLLDKVLYANIYIQPIQFCLTILTNLINIRILLSRTLRSSTCTYYFLAYAICSIIYVCLASPTQFLRAFNIDWSEGKRTCQIFVYVLFIFPFQGNCMLILASIDRYFCSLSSTYRYHCRSTIKKTKKRILISIIFSSVCMLPMSFIYYQDDQTKKCTLQRTVLNLIYVFSQVTFYYILTPISMVIFGCLTIRNIRQRSLRIHLLRSSLQSRRTNRQLIRMLILQTTVHLIFSLPFGFFYAIQSFFPMTQTRTILALRYMAVNWQQMNHFLSFFLYILSGNIYRREFQRIFSCYFCSNSSVQLSVYR